MHIPQWFRNLALGGATCLCFLAALQTQAQAPGPNTCAANEHWSALRGERGANRPSHHCCANGSEWTAVRNSCPDSGGDVTVACMTEVEANTPQVCGDEAAPSAPQGPGIVTQRQREMATRLYWQNERPTPHMDEIVLNVSGEPGRILDAMRRSWASRAAWLNVCAIRGLESNPHASASYEVQVLVQPDGHLSVVGGHTSANDIGRCFDATLRHTTTRVHRGAATPLTVSAQVHAVGAVDGPPTPILP